MIERLITASLIVDIIMIILSFSWIVTKLYIDFEFSKKSFFLTIFGILFLIGVWVWRGFLFIQ